MADYPGSTRFLPGMLSYPSVVVSHADVIHLPRQMRFPHDDPVLYFPQPSDGSSHHHSVPGQVQKKFFRDTSQDRIKHGGCFWSPGTANPYGALYFIRTFPNIRRDLEHRLKPLTTVERGQELRPQQLMGHFEFREANLEGSIWRIPDTEYFVHVLDSKLAGDEEWSSGFFIARGSVDEGAQPNLLDISRILQLRYIGRCARPEA